MGTLLKLAAVLMVIGGIWVWTTGRSVTTEEPIVVAPGQLAASIAAPYADMGRFDQEGTIVADETQGTGGTFYILYTEYNENGEPAIKTMRLVFPNRNDGK